MRLHLNVLKYTILSAIKIKSGKPAYSWKKNSSKSGIVYYDIKSAENRVYGYRFVDNYLLQCDLNKEYVEETILEIANMQKKLDDSRAFENSLQYSKLYFWWELEDDELEELISQITVLIVLIMMRSLIQWQRNWKLIQKNLNVVT